MTDTNTANAEQMLRRFKVGSTVLDDPAPDEPVDDATQYLAKAYPVVARCTVGDPQVEGEYLVYPLIKPAATTKGQGSGVIGEGRSSGDADLDRQLAEWAAPRDQEPTQACALTRAWSNAMPVLGRMLREPVASQDLPAQAIPLA